jgi:hypothetical protein
MARLGGYTWLVEGATFTSKGFGEGYPFSARENENPVIKDNFGHLMGSEG